MKLSLYYPVKPKFINQGFGDNGDYYQSHGINIKGHNGIDLQASHGQPVYATHDGTAYYEVDANSGHGVVIISDLQYDYNGGQANFKTIYWHLCDSSKEPKYVSPVEGHPLKVKTGDIIGYADNTGLSTGDHLHFGLKPVLSGEPVGTWYNPEQNNGYLGAIDPAPYFNGLFAQDVSGIPEKPKHTFYVPMAYGDSSSEVLQLQKCLQYLGYFPKGVQVNGVYGSVTSGAVFSFQKAYCITNAKAFMTVFLYMGRRAGTYTIPALNKIFS